jgi:hypothetical protein
MAKLLDALTEIDGQFGSGINFRQFDALLRRAQVAYLREPVRHQSGGCTHLVGVSAERALNSYIVGHNIWSKCVANYDTCTLDQIHARLQVRWKTASDNIAQAVNNFD